MSARRLGAPCVHPRERRDVTGVAGLIARDRDEFGRVERIAIDDPAGLGEAEQVAVDAEIAVLEHETRAALASGEPNPNLLFDDRRWPGVETWLSMRTRAIALHPLHAGAQVAMLGDGLSSEAFDAVEIDGTTARVLARRMQGESAADALADRYRAFIETRVSAPLRGLLAGSADGRAIRTRAEAATRLIVEHAANEKARRGLHVVSLACGAAEPIARVTGALTDAGVGIDAFRLIDSDPFALGAAVQVMSLHQEEATVSPSCADLFDRRRRRAIDLVELMDRPPDLIEMLGLFEYLPDRLAVDFLVRCRDAITRGGAVILANMLPDRPQQTFFQHLVQWPRLRRRSVADLRRLVASAGWPLERLRIVVPAREDVYQVALLRP
jgi:hypothetical protein